MSKIGIAGKLMIGIGVPVLMLIGVGCVGYFSIDSIEETFGKVEHTYIVLEEANSIVSSAVDMETGMRGYLLAGKDEFLDPYKGGQESFYEHINALQKTVDDNPPQVERLKDAEELIKGWQDKVTGPAIELRRKIGDAKTMNDMADEVGQAKGKVFFDKFRGQISTFIGREQALLNKRNETAAEAEKALARNLKIMFKEMGGARNAALQKAYNNVNKQIELLSKNRKWVDHTNDVISRANKVLGSAVDMETGMRGFLLAGKDGFLDPYNNGGSTFTNLVDGLKVTVNDNPSQVALLGEMNSTIGGWKSKVVEPVIELRRHIGNAKTMDDMADLIGEARGKVYFDKFRELISEFISIEQKLMKERNEGKASTVAATNYTIVISVLIAVIFGFIIGLFIIRNLLRQLGGEPEEINLIVNQIASGDLSIEFDNNKEYEGVYASMKLMTENLKQVIENDVQSIVDKANDGDLAQRIYLDDKTGFYKKLSQSINELVEVNERVVTDTVKMFGAMSRGDLTQAIEGKYKGAFDDLKKDANLTVQKLTQVIEKDIQSLVNAALDGDLSQRIDLSDKDGFFKVLSNGINELVDVSENVIKDTARVMSAMAQGDLNKTIEADYHGLFGQLKTDTNNSVAKLAEVIAEINRAAGVVSSASLEIADGNADMSKRTEEQASSLEETASSMEELTSTVKQNADNAEQANQLAVTARETANQGGQIVQEAVTAMAEINSSSNKIADIIGVIDEIAFQTNLLALNASVEAARAGEQGRGFAVVATEVRNLAQRSATAAKEIKELIQDSVGKVKVGSELVEKSGETLNEIVSGVKKVGDMIAEIAAASKEQTAGIGQVNSALSNMDDITQRNAALAEEASANSENLNSQAQTMNEQVSFFDIGNTTSSYSAKATKKASAATKPRANPKPSSVAKTQVTAAKPSDDDWEEF